MSALTVNLVPLPVSDSGGSYEQIEVGERSRAFDGSARSSIRKQLNKWSFRTALDSLANAEAYKALLDGLGHCCSFDSADGYTSRGLPPSVATNITYPSTSPVPKFGAAYMKVGATTGTITWPTVLGTRWTVAVFRYNGAAWEHYVVCSDGTKYLDGVAGSPSTTWLSVSAGGNVTIANTTGSAVAYDDLMMLPYVVPASWPAAWSAAAAAQAQLPLLNVSGDLIPNGPVICLGDAATAEIAQAVVSGAWVTTQAVAFSLEEQGA